MLYTGKGDDGKTRILGREERLSKSSAVVEALGALDEVNSFLGLAKVRATEARIVVNEERVSAIVHHIQEHLFIIQAELAGAEKAISAKHLTWLEKLVRDIEQILPPIRTFFISGGTELAALFDIARTLARRAERRAVAVTEEGSVALSGSTRAYLNRLSSALYALARLSNHRAGLTEDAPTYQ
jgi:cob(I)alamin adenosyltransferase